MMATEEGREAPGVTDGEKELEEEEEEEEDDEKEKEEEEGKDVGGARNGAYGYISGGSSCPAGPSFSSQAAPLSISSAGGI